MKPASKVVVDIETAYLPKTELSESQQEYLFREAEKITDEQLKTEKTDDLTRMMALYPFTAKIVVIGMYYVSLKKSFVMYEWSETTEKEITEDGSTYRGFSEKNMLREFWKLALNIDQVITFNGRGFDIPFLMLRSAKLGVKPTKNYMGYRYDSSRHLDLLEQLNFYKAYRSFNLDFYCHSFGIESPKSKGISGMDVQQLYEAGNVREIASYCGRDIKATALLYEKWNEYLNI